MTQHDEVIMVNGRPLYVHRQEYCAGTICSIHNPSDHPLNSAPYVWRSDRRMMERRCEHGIGHPDPDDLAFKKRTGHPDVDALGIHGCDGCCHGHKPIQMEFVKREVRTPRLLPVAKWLDSGWGKLCRYTVGAQVLVQLLLLFSGLYFGPLNSLGLLLGAVLYCGATSFVRSYKHYHSQYFRRSTR